jgi:hypothetical protein
MTQKCCGSGKGGATAEFKLGVPTGVELMDGFEDLRPAFGNVSGCNEVDDVDVDGAG